MTESILARWHSPALTLARPTVLGEPMHPAVVRLQEIGWRDATWPEREGRILAVDDALVTHNGLSFHPDGKVIASTARKFTDEVVAQTMADLAAVGAAAPYLQMEAVLCMRPGATCYGHVLAEIMPAAWLVRRLLPDRPVSLLTWFRPELAGLYRAIAAAAGAHDMPIRNCTALVRVRRLLVVDGFAETDVYLSPRIREFAEDVVRALGVDALPAGRRLFLPRRAGQGRSVRNLAEVSACLQRHGFETVHPEDLPWNEQVALFRQATHVVGVQGSALTTTMFSQPGTQVLSLVPTRMFDTFFWRIAGCCGLSYQELRCPMHEGVRSRETGRLLDQDIEVDVGLLETWLATLEGG